MYEEKQDYYAMSLASLVTPANYLRASFKAGRGARIGQSTVVSKKMHAFCPTRPEEIKILQASDAGQSFYQRSKPEEVCHLDVFHQCGMVDHRQVAASLKKAVDIYNFNKEFEQITFFIGEAGGVNADFIDIQTGTGGGRVTGSLNFGRKLSLRRAHENHVHISAMLPQDNLECLFYIVMAVEGAIAAGGLELRQNERIVHEAGGGGSGGDLSPYSDVSDSLLRRQDFTGMPASAKRYQYLKDIGEVADELDNPRDLQELLEEVEQGIDKNQLTDSLTRRGGGGRTLDRLTGLGLMEMTKKGPQLTAYGQELKNYLQHHLHEVEVHLLRAFHMVKPINPQAGKNRAVKCEKGRGAGKRLLLTINLQDGPGELAVAETVNAAACRAVEECRRELAITGQDLRYSVRQPQLKAEICLVIDASASMAGARIRAAKFLARYLRLVTPDPVSVVTFQAETARVELPLTRDSRQVEESLQKIYACGSTPLAAGLRTCVEYLQSANSHNPLIILITDGVATIGDKSRDAVNDALEAANEIRKKGYGFTCIGLKPNFLQLDRLAAAAGGTVYVLDELEKRSLVKTAWAERQGHLGNSLR